MLTPIGRRNASNITTEDSVLSSPEDITIQRFITEVIAMFSSLSVYKTSQNVITNIIL